MNKKAVALMIGSFALGGGIATWLFSRDRDLPFCPAPQEKVAPPDEGLVIQGERLEDRVAREAAERRATTRPRPSAP